MQIRSLSDVIRNHRPITLPANATVQEACALMQAHRIGAVLVTGPDGKLEGIFTGRDAVRLLADRKSAAQTKLRSVMTHNPDTLPRESKAIDALRLMQDGGFRHVPVVEGGKAVGIASIGDFRAFEHARLDEETGYWERI